VKRAREKSLSFYPANTGTNFINDYSWGSFKVHEKVWMEKYFDAFLAYSHKKPMDSPSILGKKIC
jgi:hypothetical protein